MSPELRSLDSGQDIQLKDIFNTIRRINLPIDGVTISGGEPFMQSQELGQLIDFICKEISTDILVFTGYTLEDLKARKELVIDSILDKISVLIDGPYIRELNDNTGLRGSSNQIIHVFNHMEKYIGIEIQPRKIQSMRFNEKLLLIGIKNREETYE